MTSIPLGRSSIHRLEPYVSYVDCVSDRGIDISERQTGRMGDPSSGILLGTLLPEEFAWRKPIGSINVHRLRIWSDASFVPEGLPHVPMLYPFWDMSPKVEGPEAAPFERFREVGNSILELTSLEEADVAVLPFNWEYVTWTDSDFFPASRDLAFEFASRAEAAGKPLLVFYVTDGMRDVPVDGAIVVGTSLSRRLHPQMFAVPAWSEDLLSKYGRGEVRVRRKRDRPIVGFCGFAPPLGLPMGRAKVKESLRWALARSGVIRHIKVGPGPVARAEAIRRLRRSPDVDTNFLVRPFVARPSRPATEEATLHGAPGGMSSHQREIGPASETQLQYFNNMMESDYALCSRGFGNYSYRFYEALACGRIPLFIDTDCVLPYYWEVDWRRYCLWVDERDLASIGRIVAEYHRSISAKEFEDLQRECRRLWERWISPEGYFANFHRHLRRSAAGHVEEPDRGNHRA